MLRWKGITLINGLGLAIGIAGSLVMLAFVLNESSYENFHHNKDNIVRVATDFGTPPNVMQLAGTMSALGPAAEQELPQVLKSVRLVMERETILSLHDRSFEESRFFFSDPAVFKLFTFPLTKGHPDHVLSEPFSMVISESMAKKYFGQEDPVGQTLILNNEHPLRITGIMRDVPRNTHFYPDFLVSYTSFERIYHIEPSWQQFGTTHTYLLLSDNDLTKLEQQLYDLLRRNTNENFANMISYEIQPLADIYLHSNRFGELSASGSVLYIYLFSSIAILVLIISCLNFVNLTLARFIQRSREIGIRKTLGAMRGHVIRHLFTESMLIGLYRTPGTGHGKPVPRDRDLYPDPAAALAIYAMHALLQNFAYRIDIGVWIILAANALVILLTLMTISYQTLKAANVNPVKTLRYE